MLLAVMILASTVIGLFLIVFFMYGKKEPLDWRVTAFALTNGPTTLLFLRTIKPLTKNHLTMAAAKAKFTRARFSPVWKT